MLHTGAAPPEFARRLKNATPVPARGGTLFRARCLVLGSAGRGTLQGPHESRSPHASNNPCLTVFKIFVSFNTPSTSWSTEGFPKYELYGLVIQMQKAAGCVGRRNAQG